ncbi:SGNH/GDSL hydrolase family protein [candidate division KSB1 bacterium]|nr:SGNH/GDSL hydrolase family protein [candidate division KSB1 bacterium]
MNTFKRFALIFAIFFASGEAVVRLDKRFLFFHGSQLVEISNEARHSAELDAIENGRFTVSARDLRILILGDSKIYGPGVEFNKIFSQQLKSMLNADKSLPFGNVWVLDLSRGGYNTLMNRLAYFEYVDRFQPQLVILGNNYEDVYGNQEVSEAIRKSNLSPHEQMQKAFEEKDSGNIPLFQRVRSCLYHSSLLEFVMAGLNRELKLRGVVVPGSVFHHLVYKSHREDYPGWIKAQKHLRDIITDCRQKGINLMVYSVPELNMLDNYAPYTVLDRKLATFFADYSVRYLNGVQPFLGMNSSTLALSRYDGHANAKGHRLMAQQVYEAIAPTLRRGYASQEISMQYRNHAAESLGNSLQD